MNTSVEVAGLPSMIQTMRLEVPPSSNMMMMMMMMMMMSIISNNLSNLNY